MQEKFSDNQILRLPPWFDGTGSLLVHPEKPRFRTKELLDEHGWESARFINRATAGIRAIVGEGLGGSWWAKEPKGFKPGRFDTVIVALPSKAGGAAAIMSMLLDVEKRLAPKKMLILEAGIPELSPVISRMEKDGAVVLKGEVDPWALFKIASSFHVAGHIFGFLAMLAGKHVVCHQPAFYTGWGLTDDCSSVPRRGSRTLVEVFAARAIVGSRYKSPYTGLETSFEEALDTIRLFHRLDRENRQIGVSMGMAFWKKERISAFLRAAEGTPVFMNSPKKAAAYAAKIGRGVCVWASREPAELKLWTLTADVPVYRVEDGFIRSAGLGADFIPPASITLDSDGLYFDPAIPSRLERILDGIALSEAENLRARRLIEMLVSRNVTKYGAGGSAPIERSEKRAILVPGQVEDDRSVVLGGAGITSNLELLRKVREQSPDADIIYKPHPDVEAGHRKGFISDTDALKYANRVVRTGAMADVIAAVDEVHCLTSLAGFEALLRGKTVVTYGQPFYAGWGLTTDLNPPPRRGRKLLLEELVTGTLILFPRYFDPLTNLPCTPEVLISRFDDKEIWKPTLMVKLRRLQGRLAFPFRMFRVSRSV